jgi:hypothetical protein
MDIIKFPTIASSVTLLQESFLIPPPNNAENVQAEPNTMPLLHHANVNVMLQEPSIQQQNNANVLKAEFGKITTVNAQVTNHSGTVRLALHAQRELHFNQKINNAITAQKDSLPIQSLISANQDFEVQNDSIKMYFVFILYFICVIKTKNKIKSF